MFKPIGLLQICVHAPESCALYWNTVLFTPEPASVAVAFTLKVDKEMFWNSIGLFSVMLGAVLSVLAILNAVVFTFPKKSVQLILHEWVPSVRFWIVKLSVLPSVIVLEVLFMLPFSIMLQFETVENSSVTLYRNVIFSVCQVLFVGWRSDIVGPFLSSVIL